MSNSFSRVCLLVPEDISYKTQSCVVTSLDRCYGNHSTYPQSSKITAREAQSSFGSGRSKAYGLSVGRT